MNKLFTILILFLSCNLFGADADMKRLNDPAFCKLLLPLSNNYKDASGNGNATALVGTETYQTGPFGKDRFYFNGSSRVTFSSVATNTVSWWSGNSHYAIVGASFYVNGKSSTAFTRILNHTNIGSGFTGNAWNGRAYNVDLSASEISALHKMEQFVPKFIPSAITDPSCQLLLWNGQDYAQGRVITNYKTQVGSGVMRFNGSDSYLSTPDFIGTSDFTAVVWFRANGYGENSGRVFDNGKSLFAITPTVAMLASNDGGATQAIAPGLGYVFPQWICMIITRSSGLITFYKNGLQTGTPNQTGGTLSAASTALYIGNRSPLNGTFDGSIGLLDIRLRVLSADEIKNLYDSIKIYF